MPHYRQRSRKAENQARHRARERKGLKSYRVQAVEYDLAEALIRSGRLSEDSAQTRPAIEQAVEAILRQFVCDWVRDRYR
jgi:hypothetical protein